jgi:hypothetical protein
MVATLSSPYSINHNRLCLGKAADNFSFYRFMGRASEEIVHIERNVIVVTPRLHRLNRSACSIDSLHDCHRTCPTGSHAMNISFILRVSLLELGVM